MKVKIYYRITQDRCGIPMNYAGARHFVACEGQPIGGEGPAGSRLPGAIAGGRDLPDRRLAAAPLGRPVNPGEQAGNSFFVTCLRADDDAQGTKLQRADLLRSFADQCKVQANISLNDQQPATFFGYSIADGLDHGALELSSRTAHEPGPVLAPGKRAFSHRRSAARRPACRLP